MSYSYLAEQWLPYREEDVFGFFANPDNLPLLMPEWQKARIEKSTIVPPPRPPAASGMQGPAAGMGSRITLSFRPIPYFPVRVRWEAEISDFAWNNHFCDRQLQGPFAHWKHCHNIRSIDREGMGVTVIVDHAEYDLPFGALGRLAHSLFLRRQIEHTFRYRQRRVAEIFRNLPSEPRQQHPKSA